MTVEDLDKLKSSFIRRFPLFPNPSKEVHSVSWHNGFDFLVHHFYEFIEAEKNKLREKPNHGC